ncbi:hypothetical protein BS78_04G064100 [Paspalum vaginatum]|nr:hypothetical protein BS78_04G064100 [Paspalum vaginatum]
MTSDYSYSYSSLSLRPYGVDRHLSPPEMVSPMWLSASPPRRMWQLKDGRKMDL